MAPGGASSLYAGENGAITLLGTAADVQFYGNLSLAPDGKTILGDGGNVIIDQYDEYGDNLWMFQIPTGGNNGHIAFSAPVPAPVPEPSTYIAGALMLLPFGASLLRRLRKNDAA